MNSGNRIGWPGRRGWWWCGGGGFGVAVNDRVAGDAQRERQLVDRCEFGNAVPLLDLIQTRGVDPYLSGKIFLEPDSARQS